MKGFTYMGLLFILALATAGALLVTALASTSARREKEEELLFVGEQYREAIRRYREARPKLADPYPRELGWLLRDPGFLDTRRYLRKLYRDPITGAEEWGLVRSAQGGIVGVYSLSAREPLKRAGFTDAQAAFAGARRYSDWRFTSDAAPAAAAK